MASAAASASVTGEPNAAELQMFFSRLSDNYAATHAALEKWQGYDDELRRLGDLLGTLPDETSRPVTVPIGKHAFILGKLVHTNEVLVFLGDNWYAERSAKQAREISVRRREFVQENLKKVQKDLDALKAKVTGNLALSFDKSKTELDQEGIVDIREEYTPESENARQLAGSASTCTLRNQDGRPEIASLVEAKTAAHEGREPLRLQPEPDWEKDYLPLFDKYELEEADLQPAEEEASEQSDEEGRIGHSDSDTTDTDREEGEREKMRMEMEREKRTCPPIMSSMVVEKETTKPVSESDVEDDMLMREVRDRHALLRTNLGLVSNKMNIRIPEDPSRNRTSNM